MFIMANSVHIESMELISNNQYAYKYLFGIWSTPDKMSGASCPSTLQYKKTPRKYPMGTQSPAS